MNLVEKTKPKDYIEIIKPQFVDFLTQDDFVSQKSVDMTMDRGGNVNESNSKSQSINVQVNDELLLGMTNFKRMNAKELKEKGTKNALQIENAKSSVSISMEQSRVSNDDSEASDESANAEDDGRMSRRNTPALRYERKITRRAGN